MEWRTRRRSPFSLRTGSQSRDPQPDLNGLDAVRPADPAADQQMTASNTWDWWLSTWLTDSVLGRWMCEKLRGSRVVRWLSSNPLAMLLIYLVLQSVLWLLLLWLLSGPQLCLVGFLLALLDWIYRKPVNRLVNQAWAQWRGHECGNL